MIQKDKEFIYKQISDYFQDKNVERAYVFGSFAREKEDENSDIDILVELSQSIGFMKLIEYKQALEDRLHLKVDLMTKGSISPKIFPIILKDLKQIYARK